MWARAAVARKWNDLMTSHETGQSHGLILVLIVILCCESLDGRSCDARFEYKATDSFSDDWRPSPLRKNGVWGLRTAAQTQLNLYRGPASRPRSW